MSREPRMAVCRLDEAFENEILDCDPDPEDEPEYDPDGDFGFMGGDL